MNRLTRLMAGVSGVVLMSGPALADTAMLSTFLEPSHIITRKLHVEWAEAVEKASNGELSFEVFTGGALLPALGTMTGVAQGVAQVGVHAASYTPSELPVSNAVAELGFINSDPYVLAFAYSDFMMNEEVGYDEWRKNGVIFGGGFSTPQYYFYCREVFTTHDDLKGKRARLPGAGWSRFGEYLGMVSVAIPASEIYVGLERGALDCVGADPTHLTSGATIIGLTRSVVLLPMTPGYASAGIFYNPDYWKGLTDDQRRLLFDQTARAMVRTAITFDTEANAALKEARQRGIEMVEPDASMQSALDSWIANGVGGLNEVARQRYGIEDPDALFALFQSYIDKWAELLEGVDRHDEETLTALVKTNLFNGIDAATYGME